MRQLEMLKRCADVKILVARGCGRADLIKIYRHELDGIRSVASLEVNYVKSPKEKKELESFVEFLSNIDWELFELQLSK